MHIKKGDKVKVITGSDKGKSGVVLKSFPTTSRVLIEGVNVKKRHVKATRSGKQGSIVEKAMPIHASNVKKAK